MNTGIEAFVVPPGLKEIGLLKLRCSAEPRLVRRSDSIIGLGKFSFQSTASRPMYLVPSVGACLDEFDTN